MIFGIPAKNCLEYSHSGITLELNAFQNILSKHFILNIFK